jgi:hypothetical protein
MIEALGRFTPAELRAGGINRRGLLQPLLPHADLTGDPAPPPSLVRDGEWIEPFGPLAQVLRMAAVARTVVVVEQPGANLPRLLFGRIGRTAQVLDLHAEGDDTAYGAQLLTKVEAAETVAATLPGRNDVSSPPRSPMLPAALVSGEATTLATITATSAHHPDDPPLQQRLAVAQDESDTWLVLGTRHGEEIGWSAAPPSAGRVEKVVACMLHGLPATL